MIAIFSFFLLTRTLVSSTLSTIDFTAYSTSSQYYVSSNPLGLSMDFENVYPLFDDQLLKGYTMNSNIYGDWYATFDQSIHMPLGYKYNCTLQAALAGNVTSNCTKDINNDTLLTSLGHYIYNTTMYYAFNLGWDMQNSNFSNTNYIQSVFKSFLNKLSNLAGQPFNMELVDKGNLYTAMGIKNNYTAVQFVQDCNYVNNVVYGLIMTGPGTTAEADSSWYAQNQKIYYYCGFFTFRAVAFPDLSKLTIANLLSQNYTSQFLKRRLNVNGVSYMNDLTNYLGAINDIRLTNDSIGVDGLTNSFAAAIWAIEMSMEFYYANGFRIDFYNPMLNGSFQNIYGPPPLYTPTIMYSALLFINQAARYSPYIDMAVASPGTSSSIKIYGLDYYYYYGLVILNKDMNASSSGDVKVMINDQSGLYCIYLTALSLTSTSGVTYGGLRFIGNNSSPQGNYTEFQYLVQSDGYYRIPLNYSQAAYCYTKEAQNYNLFPTGQDNGQFYQRIILLILLLVIQI